MCGATGEQTQIQQQQMQAYSTALHMMQDEYGSQQALLQPMIKQLGSIFAAGPGQEGFTPAEKEAYQTQINEGTGQNYAAAARALNQRLAAQGGTGMPSGVSDAMQLDTSLSAAREKSGEELGVRLQDYATGRQNWMQAGADLMDIAKIENPVAYEEAATGSGNAAASTANQIASQQNSWINAALGAVGNIAGDALGGWASSGFKVAHA